MKRYAMQLQGWANALLSQVPLVLMAILAFASFIVLKQAPTQSAEASQAPISQNNDYFLHQFLTTEFTSAGALRAVVQGTKASHSPITKALTIDQIAFSATSNQAHFVGSARQGVMVDSSHEFTLRDHVVIDKTPNLIASGAGAATYKAPSTHFEGAHMVLRTNPDSITSSAPVRIQSGSNTTTADSLHYDKAPDVLQLKGRVKLRVEKR